MNKLTVKRPKDREKGYSEAAVKLFINGQFVGTINQNEIKEIEITEPVIEIQAKTIGGFRSEKKILDVTKINEFNIILNTKIKISPLLILTTGFPIFIFAMNHEKYQFLKIIAFILTLFIIIRAAIQLYRVRKVGILIEESTES